MKVVCYGPWRGTSLLWQPSPGAWALTVACHSVFELTPNESPLVAKPLPLDPVSEDDERAFVEPWGPIAPIKRHPEVIVVGHAYAPPGRGVPNLVVRLGVGDLEKLLHVHGDTWFTQEGALTSPAPFNRMPLLWERAAGAFDENPVGVPMGKDAIADMQGRVFLPNVRPMGTWIKNRDEVFAPVGFGPIRPTWPTRVERLHRYAAFWDPQRWTEHPLEGDFDTSYFNVAPPDQALGTLAGNERLVLEHLHPRFPRLSTYLAAQSPCVVASVAGVEQNVAMVCDTLVVDTDRGLAFLVWRGQVALSHPQQAGMIFVTAARLADSSTRTIEASSTASGPALPFQQAPAGSMPARPASRSPATSTVALPFHNPASGQTMTAAHHLAKPALPFRSAPEPAPSTEPAREVDDEGTEPPTVRGRALAEAMAADGETRRMRAKTEVIEAPVAAPASPVFSPPVIAPAPRIFTPEPVVEPAPAPLPASPPRPPKPALASSIERCAAVAARIAAPGASRAAILAAEDLTPEVWEKEHTRWLGEIQDKLDRGNQKLMELVQEQQRIHEKHLVDLDTRQVVDLVFEEHRRLLVAYDAAYVAAIEELRGPITASEYARLSRAADRGEPAPVLAELRLPEDSINRVRRVWRARMDQDPRVAAEVRAALLAGKP